MLETILPIRYKVASGKLINDKIDNRLLMIKTEQGEASEKQTVVKRKPKAWNFVIRAEKRLRKKARFAHIAAHEHTVK